MLMFRSVLSTLDAQLMLAIAAGFLVFVYGVRCRSAKASERWQLVGLCGCATGSLTLVKGLAEVWLR